MDTDNLLIRDCLQAERIGIPKILLVRKRQLPEFLFRTYPGDTLFLQLPSIEIVCLQQPLNLCIHHLQLCFTDSHTAFLLYYSGFPTA